MFAIHRQRETHLLDLPTEEIMKILHQFLLHVIVAFLSVDTHTHTHNHHLSMSRQQLLVGLILWYIMDM